MKNCPDSSGYGRPLGVWIVGARGAVATTTMVGHAAITRGLCPPVGMLTEAQPLCEAPLAPLAGMRFGGHDLAATPLLDAALALAADGGPMDAGIATAVADDLREHEERMRLAPLRAPGTPARETIERIQRDIEDFGRANAGARTVMVNLSSTEAPPVPDVAHLDPDRLEAALDAAGTDPGVLPPSVLYAYAAIDAGVPHVNFTPSAGASLPALEQLALDRGVAHAGSDGKTGETLLKTALAPMFAMRHLKVQSWVGFNVLGNGDGRALSDPTVAVSKTHSKAKAVPSILGYEPHGIVRIDYVPSMGDWKTAWDNIQFQGFLNTPMNMQITWQGADSALAAPLVLDLARLTDLAAERGESGALGHLGFYFKSPMGSDEHDLSKQHRLRMEHVGCG
jgi:myo-inositol-1-phosphate synthase